MSVKPKTNIAYLFQNAKDNGTYLKVCAPMVRYSKLEFRRLVRMYGTDLCFTPMIMTDSFCRSEKARQVEFSTASDDTPLIAQFAANQIHEYLSSVEMIFPYVDGIDLNCGCPQRWAMQEGLGCALLKDPELVKDLTSTIRRNFPSDFSVSVKIRVQKPLAQTISLCQQLEKCGVTFLTIHGRTSSQKIAEPSNNEFLREVKQSISVPLIANGDCKSLEDADKMHRIIGCDGVMAARGILANPTLFSGKYKTTPIECVQHWTDICYAADHNIAFNNFQHHYAFMMEKLIPRRKRAIFNSLQRKEHIFDFLDTEFDLRPEKIDLPENITCSYDETKFSNRLNQINIRESKLENEKYSSESTPGKFFLEKAKEDLENSDEEEFLQTNMFDII
ncbi:tRNA-dihydrouridine(20a/20b) synthase [NAD(P)+]-like [Contarinia nasturtii]|uniref:tRNA-dihydrouridine(20a/20b) synthase [NAD(P)+]-like n=1 Tax=Contarinia nasturtii TaxID=265458 RepID=UPI0012D3F15F|nr:tRNA-dihydrouridine(20a/20b) synthase [NAD(P)+]-like [Contarinia nasturtii]